MTEVNFDIRRNERALVTRIVKRASELSRERWGEDIDEQTFGMDLTACHANGCPLRLKDLLGADDFNFVHDVWGIHRHINRDTGQVERFVPRFSAPAGC